METEAEAVAFIDCKSIGLDCSTRAIDDIGLWSGQEKVLLQSLDDISHATTKRVPPSNSFGATKAALQDQNGWLQQIFVWYLPVLAIEVSTYAQVLRLRRVIPSLASNAMERFAFPQHEQCRHSECVISELNSLPAYTSVVATPMTLPPSAYNSRPK